MLARLKQIRTSLRSSLHRAFIRFGTLRSLEPVDRDFGFNLGKPIDRYYIENFIYHNREFIKGDVLEIGEDSYTTKYATADFQLQILNVEKKEGGIQGDLETGKGLPCNAFDCIILTQTLPFVFDLNATIRNIHSMLKTNGVVLSTNPCISQISRYDMDRWGDFWRFTPLSLRKLFEQSFATDQIQVNHMGNALSATCFIQGIPAEKLSGRELDHIDDDYPVTLTLMAKKTK